MNFYFVARRAGASIINIVVDDVVFVEARFRPPSGKHAATIAGGSSAVAATPGGEQQTNVQGSHEAGRLLFGEGPSLLGHHE